MSTAKEDVYESEGNVEDNTELNNHLPDDPKHPDIETISIDVDEALKKYNGRVLNLKSMDYSDSIAKKRQHAYGNNVYVLEVAGKDYSGLETPSEKLNRLIYEIADLNEKINEDESVKSELLNQEVLDQLTNELKSLQTTSKKTGNLDSANIELPRISDPKLSSLDARLRKLEGILGSSVAPTMPILDSIEEMKLRCETLNASYVAGIEQRLNVMITKLDQVEEKREKNEIEEDMEKKINEVHDMMQKWDVACSSLPNNVNKVKSLNRLHEQAQHFGSRLSHLIKIREKLEKQVAQDRQAVLELEGTVKKELASVAEKMKKIEESVASLQ